MALAAGLTYPHRLAGVVSVSGWWPFLSSSSSASRESSKASVESSHETSSHGLEVPLPPWASLPAELPAEGGHTGEAANTSKDATPAATPLPIYFSYGTSDNTVASRLSQSSAQCVQQSLCPNGDCSHMKGNHSTTTKKGPIVGAHVSAEQRCTDLGNRFSIAIEAVQRKKHPPNQAETQKVASSIFAMLNSASANDNNSRGESSGGSCEEISSSSSSSSSCATTTTSSSRTDGTRPCVAPLAGGWSCHGSSNDELVDKVRWWCAPIRCEGGERCHKMGECEGLRHLS